MSWPGRFLILLKFEQARDFHIFFICFLSIFDKMTLTFQHWGSRSSATLIVNYFNVYSFYFTSIKPYFPIKQPITDVVITWLLYFKAVTFDLRPWPWNLTEKFAGIIFENCSSKQTFSYIAIHFYKKWPREYISNSTRRQSLRICKRHITPAINISRINVS